MEYSMTCTCGQTLTVDAEDDEDAVQKMMEQAKIHGTQVHPDENIPEAEMEHNIRTMMKKEEEEDAGDTDDM